MENKMSETKFTEEELASLREVQSKYQAIQMKFGALTMQKLAHDKQAEALADSEDSLMGELENLQTSEKEIAKSLNEKYGAGQLDPQTGVFTPTPDAPTPDEVPSNEDK